MVKSFAGIMLLAGLLFPLPSLSQEIQFKQVNIALSGLT